MCGLTPASFRSKRTLRVVASSRTRRQVLHEGITPVSTRHAHIFSKRLVHTTSTTTIKGKTQKLFYMIEKKTHPGTIKISRGAGGSGGHVFGIFARVRCGGHDGIPSYTKCKPSTLSFSNTFFSPKTKTKKILRDN